MPPVDREANLTQSVLKTLDVLECLASTGEPLSAQEVAERCGLSRPTAYRHLITLLTRDYVQTCQDSAHYHVGAKVLTLSKSFLERLELPDLAKANLRELSQATEEAVISARLGYLPDNPSKREHTVPNS